MTNPLASDGPAISGADCRIHVFEGRYDERRLGHVSKAVQDALIKVLKIPSDDLFQVIHVLSRNVVRKAPPSMAAAR